MSTSRDEDMIEAMAAGIGEAERPDMESVPAPPRPTRRLPAGKRSNSAPPPPAEKLDSTEKLNRRLAELHEHYDPFLRDLTPPDPKARPTRALERFEFRFEEPDDLTDADRPYREDGAWETINIPDYRGPVGPWAAYYRRRFDADDDLCRLGRLWLRFKGVDYRCQVFVNHRFVGGHEGFFAPFGFDITDIVRRGESNTLLIRVENDAPQKRLGGEVWQGYGRRGKKGTGTAGLRGDKLASATNQGWDEPGTTIGEEPGRPGGWTHGPAGAGIWQGVYLEGRPILGIDDLFVRPFPEDGAAELWMETWRSEFSEAGVALELTAYPNNFEGEPIELGRQELQSAGPWRSVYKLRFRLPGFRWWTLDEPHLYTLRVHLIAGETGGETVDAKDTTFGMRSFRQDTRGPRRGTFYLNGDPIVLRGTNEMGNLSVPIQLGNPDQTIEDLLISKAAHLNYWRITQRPVQSEVYDLCDRLGVLFQTDLPLITTVRQSCIEESARQAGEMERLVRSHPGAAVSSFVNEPNPDQNTQWLRHRIVDRATLEDFFEVCMKYTHLYNPDRVIKCVDGDYNPPPRHGMLDRHAYACWHEDHGVEVGKLHRGELFQIKQGWRCGVGEYGAEGLEPLHTMRKYYPASWLPDDDNDTTWTPDRIPRCQAWGWHHQWYDEQDTIRDWVAASHHQQAWSVRFVHEAYRRRADIINSTAIHLLINAWPNNWLKALCSVDREPLPGYFALADANTPLAVNCRTDRHAVTAGGSIDLELWVLNDLSQAPEGLEIVYWLKHDGTILSINRCEATVEPVSAKCQGRLRVEAPAVGQASPVTCRASLRAANGNVLHDYTLTVTVWPEHRHDLLAATAVAVLGREGGRAWRLAEAFGAAPKAWADSRSPDLVIVDTAEAARGAMPGLNQYLGNGGAILGLAQPGGEHWPLGEDGVEVRELVGHQFVSRRTGHPIVEGFDPFHFSFWYDAELDRMTHLNNSCLVGEQLAPITLTGTGRWYAKRELLPASAELKIGQGRAVLDQVWAAERHPAEPRATHYLQRSLEYLLGQS